VTGASRGIGAQLARRLAARGIEVWLADRRAELLANQVDAIRANGGRAHGLVIDLADVDATVARFARLDEEVGGIDLVIANAAIVGARGALPLPQVAWADVRDILHMNLIGSAATLFPFISRMAARGHGHIVGVSSISADCPVARSAAYAASKAGFSFFLESADIELRAAGVDVTIIHPGFVSTPAGDELIGTTSRPFLVSADKAARIIDRAIRRRARLVRFPWILGAFARLSAWLPRVIMRPLIRATSGERKQLPDAQRPAA
jgi:short-subunit dehydrogenase